MNLSSSYGNRRLKNFETTSTWPPRPLAVDRNSSDETTPYITYAKQDFSIEKYTTKMNTPHRFNITMLKMDVFLRFPKSF